MNRYSLSKNAKRLIIISVIAVVLVIFAVVMIGKIRTKKRLDRQIESMKYSISSISEENSKIEESVKNGEDESYLEQIARDEYSYVNPEERVYYESDAG